MHDCQRASLSRGRDPGAGEPQGLTFCACALLHPLAPNHRTTRRGHRSTAASPRQAPGTRITQAIVINLVGEHLLCFVLLPSHALYSLNDFLSNGLSIFLLISTVQLSNCLSGLSVRRRLPRVDPQEPQRLTHRDKRSNYLSGVSHGKEIFFTCSIAVRQSLLVCTTYGIKWR